MMKSRARNKIQRTFGPRLEGYFLSTITLVGILAVWIALYISYPAAPPPLGSHEGIGWWGWFDQGQYLKISEQWSKLDFFNPDKYYPPLYPGLIGLLWPAFGRSGYIAVDATCALLFFLLLTRIFREYLNSIAVLATVGLAYGFNRVMFDQYIMPWTTNLSSLLLIFLAWMLHAQYQREKDSKEDSQTSRENNQPNAKQGLTIAFAICALMLALRPFEILPSAVLTLGFGIKAWQEAAITNPPECQPAPKKGSFASFLRATLRLVPTLIPAAAIIIAYALYNIRTFGSIEPSYSKEINSMGFNFSDLLFKYASLVNDSRVYGTDTGYLTHIVPWYPLMLAGAVIGVFTLSRPIRYLIAASLLSQASYLGFNDLVPTGLFIFNNIHYFTWSIAVIGVSSIATAKNLTKEFRNLNKRLSTSFLIKCLSIGLIAVVLGGIQPKASSENIELPDWQTSCLLANDSAAKIDVELTARHSEPRSASNKSARLLKLMLPTESSNENIHTANADKLSLLINGKAQVYRKDWRLVSTKEKNMTLLAILLNKEVLLKDSDIDLLIKSGSNIDTRQACSLYNQNSKVIH